MSAASPDRTPAAVLTGLLGSGKVALLNRLLGERAARRRTVPDDPGGARDHGERVAPAEERISELDCGAICCAVHGDPIRLLGTLMRRHDPRDYALVESAGLADPAPAIRTVLDGGELERDAVVTVVDALQVSTPLDPSGAGEAQAASAAIVLLGLGSGRRAQDEATQEVLARPGRYREVRDGLRVKEIVIGEGERKRRHLICHAPAEERRQRERRAKLLLELEANLRSLPAREGDRSARAAAFLASSRHGRYLRETPGGKLRIDRAAVADAERHDGKWLVTTNDDTLAVEDLARGHGPLMPVEACWRELGAGLRAPSVRHLHPWPTETHLMMSVLALLLERVVEFHDGRAWRDVADALHQIEVVEPVPARTSADRKGGTRKRAALLSSA